jgi:hypothetical protein
MFLIAKANLAERKAAQIAEVELIHFLKSGMEMIAQAAANPEALGDMIEI